MDRLKTETDDKGIGRENAAFLTGMRSRVQSQARLMEVAHLKDHPFDHVALNGDELSFLSSRLAVDVYRLSKLTDSANVLRIKCYVAGLLSWLLDSSSQLFSIMRSIPKRQL